MTPYRAVLTNAGAALFALALLASCTDQPLPSAPVDVRLARAGGSGPTVTKTDPSGSPRGLTLDVRVYGSGFDAGTSVRFGIDGSPSPEVVTNSTRVVTSKELVANITITSEADPSLYDVLVTTGGGKPGIGTELFEIIVLQDLGALTTTGSLSPYAIGMSLNTTADPDNVMVVGHSARGSVERNYPMYWTNSTGMQALNAPAGITHGWPQGVSDNGTIVGVIPHIPTRAFRTVAGGAMIELPMLTRSVRSDATGITPDGTLIVGTNHVTTVNGADTTSVVVVWRNSFTAADSVGPGRAYGISADLTIAGWSNGPHVWTFNGTSWTGTALPGGASSVTGISRDGSHIVGSTDTHGVLWRRAGTSWERIELPGIATTTTTTTKKRNQTSTESRYFAHSVNSSGLVVGVGSAAVLWYPDGTGYKARIMPEAHRFGGSWAQAINDNNQVTGRVRPESGGWHAVLWTLP